MYVRLSQVGYYHIDEDDTFHLAEKDCFAKLKDRRDIKLPLDLNEGYTKEAVDKPYAGSCLSWVMEWIRMSKYNLRGIDIIMMTNDVFVTIGKTLIDYYKKEWYIECFMLDGMIYVSKLGSALTAEMEEEYIRKDALWALLNAGKQKKGASKIIEKDRSEDESVESRPEELEDHQYKPLYYGMRFEDVLTTNNKGYNYSVITTNVAGYNVLTRAEIDCTFNDEYVELKVGLDPRNQFEDFKFRKQKLGETCIGFSLIMVE